MFNNSVGGLRSKSNTSNECVSTTTRVICYLVKFYRISLFRLVPLIAWLLKHDGGSVGYTSVCFVFVEALPICLCPVYCQMACQVGYKGWTVI